MDDTKPSSSAVPPNLPQASAPNLVSKPVPPGPVAPSIPTPLSVRPTMPPAAPLRIDSLSIPKIQPTSPIPAPRPMTPPTPPLSQPVSPLKPLTPTMPPVSSGPNRPLQTLPQQNRGSAIPTPNQNLGGIGTIPVVKPPVVSPPLTSNLPSSALNDVSLKSSIRTMQDDLAAIKKGQMPIGIELQKSKSELPPMPPPTAKPVMPVPIKPLVQVGLGKAQTAQPLNQPGAPAPTPPSPSKGVSIGLPGMTASGVAIPRGASDVGRRNLYLLIIGVIIVVGVAGYFVYSHYSSTTTTPTPVVTVPTPTPTLNGLEAIFGVPGSINIPAGADPYATIRNATSQNGNPGEINFYSVSGDSNTNFGFSNFLVRLTINHPSGLDVLNDPNGFLLGSSASGVSTSKKSFAMVATVANANDTSGAMRTWESTASADLKTLFGLDPAKRSSQTFQDNSYQGVAIRYMNFPDANSTIDYAIVSTPSDSNFLVIASSKALIYSIIDILVASQSR